MSMEKHHALTADRQHDEETLMFKSFASTRFELELRDQRLKLSS